MDEVFESYIDNAFGQYQQAEFKFKQFETNYRKYFPTARDAFLLDIGIGRGEMLSCMKNWGYANSQGIDISKDTVAFCSNLGLNCIHVPDTPVWLRENRDRFDVVMLLDVLEHVGKKDLLQFLKAILESLKKTGLVIIQVPNLQSPDGQLHRYNDITHEIGFVEHSLNQVLRVAGFHRIEMHGFEDGISHGFKEILRIVLRKMYWKYVRTTRLISGNLNPKILHPVLFAVARKSALHSG